MPVYVIDTIKPKNDGSFPVVEAADVALNGAVRLPEAIEAKADKETTDSLQSQIDAIAGSTGTSTADTEIAQARVDADGVTHDTLKDRLDASDEGTAMSKASALVSCDLDDIDENGIWILVDSNTYDHLPTDFAHKTGYLFCFVLGGWNVQIFVPFTRNGIYRRASNSLNSWQDWAQITDNGLESTITGIIDAMKHSNEFNRYDVIAKNAIHTDTIDRGITFDWTGDICHVTGTAEANSFCNIFNENLSNSDFKAGGTYYLSINDAVTSQIYIRIYYSTDGTTLSSPHDIKKSGYFTIPNDTIKMIIRFQTTSGTVASCYAYCYVLNYAPIENYSDSQTVQLDSCDLNTLRGNKVWLLADNRTYDNLPTDKTHKTGYLFTYKVANWWLQIFVPFTFTGIYRRASNNGTSWQAWTQIADGGGGDVYNITNNYDVTAEPTITTDTNNFLAATGDNSDVKLSIISMLQTTGVCHLGPGDFYVSGIDMPNDTMLIGSGPKTRVILLGTGSTTGYAVKLGNRCSVKDLAIYGSTTDIPYSSVSSTITDRHGILFEANYDVDQSYKERCNIENVWIKNFAGGGITCRNTGYGTSSCMNVSNVYIYQCNAGIYVPYWSEFHRFTNVHVHNCYYGAVNNGGNCSFVNCGFSGNRIGMLMDNGSNQAPNNSHGQVIGCIFDHSDANAGIGIKLDGMRNGQIFTDCQLFYSDILVQNSAGIQFNNFNCGGRVGITVTKNSLGGLVMFNNFVFAEGIYTISVEEDYTACKFNNCWTKTGNAVTG